MKKILSFLFIILVFFTSYSQKQSAWVYKDKNGKLFYKTTPAGDRIIDFSHAGYMGGGVAIPNVPVKKVIKPSGSDDTKAIQDAIDEIAKLPVTNGIRGAVLLAPGKFNCSASLQIHTSGIVVRGSGKGKGGTTIWMSGPRHAAFIIGRTGSQPETATARIKSTFTTRVSAHYIPFGTSKIKVEDAAGFVVGDVIEIRRPVTSKWTELMQMHNLKRDGRPQTWLTNTSQLIMQRHITSISGKELTIDVPIVDSYDPKYLDPPGMTVTKIQPYSGVQNVGIEKLHVQSPPLETSYGNAPYAGVRINANDCWIRDVYFEEMMNTIEFNGDRNTVQRVDITHTYPNLGASKPADYSFEGSQNLIDRCTAEGGNTYFVWTSSLVPGPNVMLNCTFRGHGSRIQPHHRWSTAMLVDNCTNIDGGIDFLNRGVAGSGHGWTMGWGVAWNNIAKTYIIQQPPGSANWAIGNIGMREKTARLFDSSPILEEGYFESHGSPVTPQSLYLAQLNERKGMQALKNLGYSGNSLKEFQNKKIKPSKPQLKSIDKIFGEDLALHRPVNTSSIRGNGREFAGEKALDANDKTWWSSKDSARATIEIDMEGPVDINAIQISEASGAGRILEYKVEGQVQSDWLVLGQGTTIGSLKTHEFPMATVWKVRITINKAEGYSALRRVSLYRKK